MQALCLPNGDWLETSIGLLDGFPIFHFFSAFLKKHVRRLGFEESMLTISFRCSASELKNR